MTRTAAQRQTVGGMRGRGERRVLDDTHDMTQDVLNMCNGPLQGHVALLHSGHGE